LPRVRELAEAFDDHSQVAADWKHLKRYAKLERTIGLKDTIAYLTELRASGDPLDLKNADWIETVAFHPDSNVSLEAVMQFATTPAKFFARPGTALEDALSPSKYSRVEHLDLSAEELASAYRTGQLDELQSLPPMSRTFTLPSKFEDFESTREALEYALGSRAKGDGAAISVKKLYHKVKHLLPDGVDVMEYVAGEEIPVEIEQQIEETLFNSKIGLRGQPRKFRAMVHLASSPEGSIVGDDTACCMPFGSPKNTHYMLNPNCSFFTVQLERPEGGFRTIAQSVVEIDRETGVSFPILRSGMQDGWGLSEVLTEDLLSRGDNYFEADNIEMARNYAVEWRQHVALIYRSFAKAYVGKLKEIRPVVDTQMPIGQGYTDDSFDLDSRENTMVKVVPTSYTDNSGTESYVLDLQAQAAFSGSVEREFGGGRSWPDQFAPGVHDLTFQDVLQAGYINDLAFPHQSPYYNLYDLQNAIVASGYNNHLKGRPNLSLKHVNEEGKFTGYMLAYHGKLGADARRAAKLDQEQEVVFMSLIAGHPGHSDAGGPMLREFVRRYKAEYVDKGNPLPILSELREGTTYEFARRQLKRLARSIGADFEMVEIGTVRSGEEMCHRVLIVPAAEAERFRASASKMSP
ncbi:MAG: hypothetical protein KDD70_14895, partial [Bdellovibrionales bacterium]|nr:hypothetical protein [Bdellovibrionales bacterium]